MRTAWIKICEKNEKIIREQKALNKYLDAFSQRQ